MNQVGLQSLAKVYMYLPSYLYTRIITADIIEMTCDF